MTITVDHDMDQTDTTRYTITLPTGHVVLVDVPSTPDTGNSVDVWVTHPDADYHLVAIGDTPSDGFATYTPVF